MKLERILLFFLSLIALSCGQSGIKESQGELPKNTPTTPIEVQMIYQGSNYLEFELKAGQLRGKTLEDIKNELEKIGSYELKSGFTGNKIIDIVQNPLNKNIFKVIFAEDFRGGINYEILFRSEEIERSFEFSFRLSEGIEFTPFAFEDDAIVYDIIVDKDYMSGSEDFLVSNLYILKHFRPGDAGFDIVLAKGDVEHWVIKDDYYQTTYRMKIAIKDIGLNLQTDDQINLIYTDGYKGFRIIVDQTWVAKVASGVDSRTVCISLDKSKFKDNNTFCMGANLSGVTGIGDILQDDLKFIYPWETTEPQFIKDFVFDQTVSSEEFACGYSSSSMKVYCWGNYNNFKKSMGNQIPSSVNIVSKPHETKELDGKIYNGYFTVDKKIKSMKTGYTISCYENISGELYCWGPKFTNNDVTGEFQFHTSPFPPGPVRVSKEGEIIKGYTVGNYIACYINQDDQEVCYSPDELKLGLSSSDEYVTSYTDNQNNIRIQGYLASGTDEKVISLGAGSGNYCGILENTDGGRRIKCRGNNPIHEGEIRDTYLKGYFDGYYDELLSANTNLEDPTLHSGYGMRDYSDRLQEYSYFSEKDFYPEKISVSQNTVCLVSSRKEIKCKTNFTNANFPSNFKDGKALLDAKTSIKDIVSHDQGICIKTEELESVDTSENERKLVGKVYCYGGINNQYPYMKGIRNGELKIPVK